MGGRVLTPRPLVPGDGDSPWVSVLCGECPLPIWGVRAGRGRGGDPDTKVIKKEDPCLKVDDDEHRTEVHSRMQANLHENNDIETL